MKRPIFVIGITYFAAQLAAVAFGYVMSAVLCLTAIALAAASFALLSDKHRRVALPVLVSCAIAFGVFAVYAGIKTEPVKELYGKTVYIRGEIVQQPYTTNGRSYYVVDTDYIEDSGVQKTRIRISSQTPLEAEINDIFSGTITVNAFDDEIFSTRAGQLSRGICLTAYVSSYIGTPEITEGRRTVAYYFSEFRNAIDSRINSIFDKNTAGMLRGVMLGNKSGIASDVISDFRICGLSHLLAVSGLHLSMLAAALREILKRFELHYRPLAAVLIVFIWIYAALTGFSFSVLRAAIMHTMMLLARVLNREGDTLTAFGTALLTICLFSPFAAADAGLMLSVTSTFGLIVISRKLERYAYGLIYAKFGDVSVVFKHILSAVIPSVVATLSTVPVVMVYFGELSLIAPIANLLCIELSKYFMLIGAMAVIVSCVPFIGGFIAVIFSSAAWLLGRLISFAVELLSRIPYASVMINYRFLPVFIVCSVIIFAVWYFLWKDQRTVKSLLNCVALAVILLIIGMTAEGIQRAGERYIKVYDVDEGLAVAAVSGYNCAVIGTGGDRYYAWQMTDDLRDENFSRIDAVVYPYADDRYASYAEEFNESVFAKQIYIPCNPEETDDLKYSLRNADDRIISTDAINYTDGDLSVISYTDSDGLVWIELRTGDIRTVICPEGGNCMALPAEMRYPWCAVIISDEITNLSVLSPSSIVVSADERVCADIAARLRYRGFEYVYTTAQGNVIIKEKNSGMLIGGE